MVEEMEEALFDVGGVFNGGFVDANELLFGERGGGGGREGGDGLGGEEGLEEGAQGVGRDQGVFGEVAEEFVGLVLDHKGGEYNIIEYDGLL